MSTFSEKEYNENLSAQVSLAKAWEERNAARERIEEGEAAIYSLILVTCFILTIGSLISIYKTLRGG